MTTIVCNRTSMAADRRISSMPIFRTTKLFRVNGSIIGVAGQMDQCLRFIEWRRNPESKPAFTDTASLCALELTADGTILWWGTEMIAVPIEEDFYAVGSGAEYALGAMDMGAAPARAIKAAARWNGETGSEVQTMRLKGKP